MLSRYFLPGTLITHLDDLELHDSDEKDHWRRYLTTSEIDPYASMGWCVDQDVLAGTLTPLLS